MHPINTKKAEAYPENEGAGARDAVPLFANQHPGDSAAESAAVKRLATAAAKLARAGFSLQPAGDGGFIVARWNCSRTLQDLAAVEQFLSKVTA